MAAVRAEPLLGNGGARARSPPRSAAHAAHPARRPARRRDLSCGRGCTVKAAGQLYPGLAQMEYLQQLDLSGNAFYGGLAPEWGLDGSFPELLTL